MPERGGFSNPAAPEATPGHPQNFHLITFDGFAGLNTKPTRPAIEDQQLFWCDNFMPLGKNNLRTLYDVGTAIAHIDNVTGGLMPGPDPTGFVAEGVTFDGATTVSNAALSAADSGDLSWSFWVRFASPPIINTDYFISTLGNDIGDEHASTGDPAPAWPYNTGWSVDGGATFFAASTASFPTQIPAATWVNVKVSLRTNFALGLKTIQIFINDTDVTSSILDTAAAFQIPFNGAPFYVGAVASIFPGQLLVGDLAEYWWAPGQFIDWSVEATRRKFISAGGLPVDLGSDGSTPTGTAPVVYLSVRSGDSAADFATNRGTGGAFAITAGSLTLSSTNPGP